MSGAPKRVRRRRDHDHVGRISTMTTIAVLVAAALLFYAIRWVLPPFVFAGLVAYICTPLVEAVTARCGLPRWLVALVLFAILLAAVSAIGLLAVPPLVREMGRTLANLDSVLKTFLAELLGAGKITLLGRPTDAAQMADAGVSAMRDWLGQPGAAAAALGIAFTTGFGFILTLVLLGYFLVGGPQIARGLLFLVPPEQRPLVMHIWVSVDPVLKRYFVGVLGVVAYATIAAYIGLGLFLGIPHAVVLAIATGVLETIPMVGPAASAILAGLVAVHHATGIGPILAYAIYATALRLSIDQFFGPLALGAAARLSPVLVIFCFLAGGALFGLIGVLLAVPVALVVKVTLTLLYDEEASSAA